MKKDVLVVFTNTCCLQKTISLFSQGFSVWINTTLVLTTIGKTDTEFSVKIFFGRISCFIVDQHTLNSKVQSHSSSAGRAAKIFLVTVQTSSLLQISPLQNMLPCFIGAKLREIFLLRKSLTKNSVQIHLLYFFKFWRNEYL